ncbi:MAG: substrate-binding domain-containing protein [Verrucomicrobiales bacterium]|nr:substrate-binding domain-containing protein [Verrucomicrobiales bacterium]
MKPFCRILGVVSCALVLSGCGDGGSGGAGGAAGGAAAGYTLAVIPKGTTHEFWRSIEAGARKAEAELNAAGTKVNVIWKGPLREDDRDQQIQVVENFTTRRVSSIVLAPLDSQALVKPVESAIAAGIPTVVIDSDLKSDKYVSFVATDNFRGGQMGAEHLAKLMGEKGNVILLRYAVGSASTEAREAGFMDAIKKFPNIKILSSDQYAGATRETAYAASQNLLNRYARDLNGVFCPSESTAVGMAKALRDLGYAGGKVKMVGFDTGAQSVADLRAGDIQGLVVQNPLRMGYEGVMTAVRSLKGETVPKRVDTGVTLISKDNMDLPDVKELLEPPLAKYLK